MATKTLKNGLINPFIAWRDSANLMEEPGGRVVIVFGLEQAKQAFISMATVMPVIAVDTEKWRVSMVSDVIEAINFYDAV